MPEAADSNSGRNRALIHRLDTTVRLVVHKKWCLRPWYRGLGRWIAAGEHGDVQMGQLVTLDSSLLPDANRRRPALDRQPFMPKDMTKETRLMITEVLIHHLDVMRFLFGPLRAVSAVQRVRSPVLRVSRWVTSAASTRTALPVQGLVCFLTSSSVISVPKPGLSEGK